MGRHSGAIDRWHRGRRQRDLVVLDATTPRSRDAVRCMTSSDGQAPRRCRRPARASRSVAGGSPGGQLADDDGDEAAPLGADGRPRARRSPASPVPWRSTSSERPLSTRTSYASSASTPSCAPGIAAAFDGPARGRARRSHGVDRRAARRRSPASSRSRLDRLGETPAAARDLRRARGAGSPRSRTGPARRRGSAAASGRPAPPGAAELDMVVFPS